MCGTTLFQNPATARTAGSCERIGATKAPVLSPAFFRPPVHFQKHGNPPTEVGPIVVGKPHVILPFDEKGQCRREVSRLFATLARQGPKAVVCGQRMPPRPRPPDTAAHRGRITGDFMTEKNNSSLLQHRKTQQAAESMTGQRPVSFPALRPLAAKWVRASARNCVRRIAGRDACPT